MEVILKEDVPKLGSRGDVVKVAEGFGRNYLLPHKLAIEASKGWGGDSYVIARRGGPEPLVAWATTWDDEAAAKTFEAALRKRCARLGGSVQWQGYLANDQVMAHYRQAAIVVLPSLSREAAVGREPPAPSRAQSLKD